MLNSRLDARVGEPVKLREVLFSVHMSLVKFISTHFILFNVTDTYVF